MEQSNNAHKHLDRSQMFSLIAECEQSDMTVKAFCAHHQIQPANYYYWLRKYRDQSDITVSKGNFSLLRVGSSVDGEGSGLFAEVNGIKIYREVPASYLKELLA